MIEWSYEALPKLRSRPHRFSGRIILALTSPIAGVFIFSARNKPLAMLAFRSGMCVTFIDSLLKQKIISDDEANTIYEQLVQRIQNA